MATIANAYVQILPSAEGIKGSLTNALSGEANSAGSSAGLGLASGIKKAIVGAGIGVAVGKVVKDSLSEGAALEQSIGGIQTLFGNQGKDIATVAEEQGKKISEVAAEYGRNAAAEANMMKYAERAYETAGLSRNEYMEQATSFSATLLQGLEGDTLAAADYADKAMIAMSDNANKFGTDISSVQNAYQGFAKNNYTMLDNLKLGYGGTAEEMARLINDSGVLGDSMEATAKNVKDIPFNQVIDAIGVIQDRLGVTGTTADEAATTFSGSMQMMQASGKNLLASLALGEDMVAPLTAFASSVLNFVQNNLLPMIGNILTAVPEVISKLIQKISQSAGTFLPVLLDMIRNVIDSVMTNLPTIIDGVFQLISAVGDAIMSYNWGSIMTQVVDGLTSYLQNDLPRILEMGITFITTLIQGIINNLPMFIKAGLQVLEALAQGILAAIPTLIQSAADIINSLVTFIIQDLPQLLVTGVEILLAIVQGIIENISLIMSTIVELISTIVDTIINNLPQLISAGIEILLAVIAGIIQALPEIIAASMQAIGAIQDTFASINWLEIGGAIIEGIILGLANGVGALVDAVKAAAKKALDSAKSFLGINSPSRVFRDDVGQMIDEGMAEGIVKYTSPIKSAMNGLTDMTQGTFKAANSLVNGNTYANTELAPAGYGDLTIPVYIGNQKFGQAVVSANQITNYRKGGY